ncbi:hypothetical protein XENOCAPTIV_007462 [Xenoophorus captivus]|uniref:C2H2-type domain-containing protein n=1 Tax=Xenoophorus captivus TaxID=1517983 RepID=A0ABV0RG82_9TELE
MSKKRSGSNSLKASIEQQLAAAASEIFRLLEEHGQAELGELRELVMTRIAAAVELILTAFEARRAAERGTLEPGERRRGGRGEERKELCLAVGVRSQSVGISVEERLPASASRPEIAARLDHQAVLLDDDTAEQEDDHTTAADETSHSCKVCGKSFLSKGLLIKHVEKHTKEEECRCGVCAESLESSDGLKQHLQTHRDSCRTCNLCGKKFPSIRAMETHVRLHTGEKPFNCHLCAKSFSQKGNMVTHQRTHMEEKCSKDFCNTIPPEQDMNTNNGQMAFECKVCGTGFLTSSELRWHTRTHNQPNERSKRRKPSLTPSHSCKVCGNSFHNKGNLLRHTETHLNHPDLLCGVCGERAESSESLQLHIQSHREISKVCDICGDNFRDMEIHMRTHTGQKPFRCKECCKDFPRKSSLERHLKLHGDERPYICEFCGKTFIENTKIDLKRHMLTHTGEKPFSCHMCGKSYQEKRSLESHMKVHLGERATRDSAVMSNPKQQQEEEVQPEFIQL